MSTWSGQPRIVDRKGNVDNVPIRCPHPFLCLVGGMVPDMIGSFCDEKGRHDGFIDRILFTYPDPVPRTVGGMKVCRTQSQLNGRMSSAASSPGK